MFQVIQEGEANEGGGSLGKIFIYSVSHSYAYGFARALTFRFQEENLPAHNQPHIA